MKHILILNRWRTPDGTILVSKHRHDFVQHYDTCVKDEYFIDGGNDYVRMSKNAVPMVDMCIYADGPYETVRQHERRGAMVSFKGNDNETYYKTVWVPLRAMSDQHLCNCIVYNLKNVNEITRYEVHTHLYVKEMLYRISHDLFLDEYDYTEESVNTEPKYETVEMEYRKIEVNEAVVHTLDDIKEQIENAGLDKDAVHSFDTYAALTMLDKMYSNLEDTTEEILV